MSTPSIRVLFVALLATAFMGGCGNDSTSTDSTSTTDVTDVSSELATVIADAQRMAPALESRLRGTTYPTTVDEARQALTDAGIEPTAGNAVGGYEYDPDSIEFKLCIEGSAGAFAVYDTRPMSLFENGESGGCP